MLLRTAKCHGFHKNTSIWDFHQFFSLYLNLQFQVIFLVKFRVEEGFEENLNLIFFFMKPSPGYNVSLLIRQLPLLTYRWYLPLYTYMYAKMYIQTKNIRIVFLIPQLLNMRLILIPPLPAQIILTNPYE